MKEISYSIGKSPRLMGIYTENDPAGSRSASRVKKPAILLLNSGLLPRTGPFRLYVELARRFAKMGFNTFRFDFPGIGDSDQHADARTLDEFYMDDLKAVMNFLEAEQDDRQFILMGICSGARYAHDGMAMDGRVVGVVAIDGYLYRTPGYYLRLYGSKLFSLSSYVTALKLAYRKITSSSQSDSDESKSIRETSAFSYSFDSKKRVGMDFKKFIDCGVPLCCIFTGSFCKYENQLADGFKEIDFGETIEITYLRNAAHIFPLIEDQRDLTSSIIDWLNRKFGA